MLEEIAREEVEEATGAPSNTRSGVTYGGGRHPRTTARIRTGNERPMIPLQR